MSDQGPAARARKSKYDDTPTFPAETHFTPGPWFVAYSGKSCAVHMMPITDGWLKKNETASFDRSENGIANANLIAAAPDLYAALEEAQLHLIGELDEPGRTVFWKIVDALAKARGET